MAGKHLDVIEFNEDSLRRRAAGASEGIRRRVEALIAVARGDDSRLVADRLGVEHGNLIRWVRAFNDGGYDALVELKLGRSADMRGDYDAPTLRHLAENVTTPETKNRLLALASMYDGQPLSLVSIEAGVSEAVIRRWRTSFDARGPLVERETAGSAKLDADLAVSSRTELNTVAKIVEKLSGEQREKAEAILMSARSLSVARISEALGRPINWTIAVIRTFNGTGTESLFGIRNHGAPSGAPIAKPIQMALPAGYTVKSLIEAAGKADGQAKADLLALSKLYLHKNRKEAAEVSGVSEIRLAKLTERLAEGGVDAISRRPSYSDLDANKVEAVAQEYSDKVAAAKLFALARVIRGETFAEVAAEVGTESKILRSLMHRLEKFGPGGVPDRRPAPVIWERPKSKTSASSDTAIARVVPAAKSKATGLPKPRVLPSKPAAEESRNADPANTVHRAFVERVRAAVAAESANANVVTIPEVEALAIQFTPPFVDPRNVDMIRVMADDSEYSGRNLARAMLEFVRTGDRDTVSETYGVATASIDMFAANIPATVDFYASRRVPQLLADAGITVDKVRRLATRCPHGWMSKLRSIAFLAEGRTVAEVCSITKVDPARLARWTQEIATGWTQAETQMKSGPRKEPQMVASGGMRR
jgi:transposase